MSTLDRDALDEIAKRCLERPSNAHFYDDRLFDTHGAVLSWAEQSDDILDESNYLTALELIKGAAGDDADAHIIDGTERHFARGYMRALYVQVYETFEDVECECPPVWEHEDDCERDEDSMYCQLYCAVVEEECEECFPEKQFTDAFVEAAELVDYLRGGGSILDESDFSEREWKAFESNCTEAIEQATRNHDDTWEQDAAIQNLMFEESALSDLFGHEANAGVSWDKVAEIYEEYRDRHFGELAYEIYRWNMLGYNPDQLELDFAA
ncbi:hypothetical protein [Streptomyces parvus]|uniref:hypothetical protein n=1 Tax=Streptomyces parvus TaxID=66428 RepID=UPI003D70D223